MVLLWFLNRVIYFNSCNFATIAIKPAVQSFSVSQKARKQWVKLGSSALLMCAYQEEKQHQWRSRLSSALVAFLVCNKEILLGHLYYCLLCLHRKCKIWTSKTHMLKVQSSPSWLQKHYVTRRVGLVIDKSLAKDGSFIPHIILHFENRKT